MTTALDAITTATLVRPDGVSAPARFALEPRPDQDPTELAERVRAALDPLGATVTPLSVLEPGILVAEFPDRFVAPDPTAAFVAAHELRAQFDLAAAEPDLPTAFFPEAEEIGRGPDIGLESVGPFPPGCYAPEEPTLDPRWALQAMRVPEAWAFSEARQRAGRGAGVVVAQPDTGVTAHPELDGVAVAPGRDVLGNDDDPTDPLSGGSAGHGTGTASVVVSPETLVVAGTAPLARHMPIRAIQSVIRIGQVNGGPGDRLGGGGRRSGHHAEPRRAPGVLAARRVAPGRRGRRDRAGRGGQLRPVGGLAGTLRRLHRGGRHERQGRGVAWQLSRGCRGRVRARGERRPVITQHLDAAIGNPVLRRRLGLSSEPEVAPR